jgi:acetyl-CoA C-acetyltransferase
MTLEDLGFCEKGEGGRFVLGRRTSSHRVGELAVQHRRGRAVQQPSGQPGRGGMTKVIEAVRQLRGEAHPLDSRSLSVQIALAHGSGGLLGSRMTAATR